MLPNLGTMGCPSSGTSGSQRLEPIQNCKFPILGTSTNISEELTVPKCCNQWFPVLKPWFVTRDVHKGSNQCFHMLRNLGITGSQLWFQQLAQQPVQHHAQRLCQTSPPHCQQHPAQPQKTAQHPTQHLCHRHSTLDSSTLHLPLPGFATKFAPEDLTFEK